MLSALLSRSLRRGEEKYGKKGVVRDKSVHIAVIEKIIGLIAENNFSLLGLDFSPIKGPEGNIEYLCFIEKDEKSENRCEVNASQVVELSYKALER